MSSGCYNRTPQQECACVWADVGRSQAPHDNGSAVGADLSPSAPKLTSIKAHGHDRVTASLGGLLDEPLDRLLTTLSQRQARPELLEQRPGWGGEALNATTFLLEPLTGGHTAALLEGLLGPAVPGRVVAAVDGWAEGNPLFVEEVAAHLVETGVLRREHDGWVVVGDLKRVLVPPTVTALLAARLDRIPLPERALLERVSVIGLELTTADATALSADGVEVPALLASLSRRDLLRRVRGLRADTWAFRHVLLRDAAYESLPKSVRAVLHERFADRLQESAADAGGETHAFVGHHLEQAYLSDETSHLTAMLWLSWHGVRPSLWPRPERTRATLTTCRQRVSCSAARLP
jgi:predicted ATPase